LSNLGGIAVAPDGRIWIGDFGNVSSVTVPRGLWFAPNLDTAPTKITGDYQVECLAYQPATDTLYACQRWAMGSVDQKTGAFSPLFSLATAKDFVTCGGTNAAAVCKIQLCNAYCGPLHFAQAPLCAAYDDPMCGPGADGPLQVSGAAGNSAVGGNSAIGGGMSAVGGIGGATTAPPRTSPATKAGGCATATPGTLTGAAGQMAFIGLGAMILWRRNRRREPRCLA
jgi:hypothetical protein